MNGKIYEFEAELKEVDGVDGAYVKVPFDIKQEFGKYSVCVSAKLDGEKYQGCIMKMGGLGYIMGIRKSIRTKIRKQPGDRLFVSFENHLSD